MRSPRLTREAIIEAESRQAEVIAALTITGEGDLARRMTNCQSARLWRDGSFLRCCRLAGCFSCRRPVIRKWWVALMEWAGPEATLVSIPLGADVIGEMHALRRGLRDVRDRAAYRRPAWREVAFGGIVSGATAVVWVVHPNIPQAALLAVLRQRWPNTAVLSPVGNEPSWAMDTDTAVRLSVLRRGIEPMRAVVMPQGALNQPAPAEVPYLEPMPMLL